MSLPTLALFLIRFGELELWFLYYTTYLCSRRTACVTRLGWESRFAFETGVRGSQKNAQKNAARTPSRVHALLGAFVLRRTLHWRTLLVTIFSVIPLNTFNHFTEAHIQCMGRNVNWAMEKHIVDSFENTTQKSPLT